MKRTCLESGVFDVLSTPSRKHAGYDPNVGTLGMGRLVARREEGERLRLKAAQVEEELSKAMDCPYGCSY